MSSDDANVVVSVVVVVIEDDLTRVVSFVGASVIVSVAFLDAVELMGVVSLTVIELLCVAVTLSVTGDTMVVVMSKLLGAVVVEVASVDHVDVGIVLMLPVKRLVLVAVALEIAIDGTIVVLPLVTVVVVVVVKLDFTAIETVVVLCLVTELVAVLVAFEVAEGVRFVLLPLKTVVVVVVVVVLCGLEVVVDANIVVLSSVTEKVVSLAASLVITYSDKVVLPSIAAGTASPDASGVAIASVVVVLSTETGLGVPSLTFDFANDITIVLNLSITELAVVSVERVGDASDNKSLLPAVDVSEVESEALPVTIKPTPEVLAPLKLPVVVLVTISVGVKDPNVEFSV